MTFHTTTALMRHQSAAVEKLSPTRVGALFMDMGTGKSRTVIEMAKVRQAKWDRLFWFCPCALRDTVLEQILAHTDIPHDNIHVWDNRGVTTMNVDAMVHIIGIETMSSSDRAVFRYRDLVTVNSYVVVDESSYIKGNRARRTQRITRMSEQCRYRTILTGTPLSQGVTDLYSQMYFLSPEILGYRSWYSFAEAHITYDEKVIPGTRLKKRTGRILSIFNKDIIAAKIEPYVFQVRKSECLDLPKKVYLTRTCELTDAQARAYSDAKDDALSIDIEDWGEGHILKLFSRLQKIVCGFEGTAADGYQKLESRRLDILLETIAEIAPDEKIIIWSKYLESARMIMDALTDAFGADGVAEFTGNVPEKKRSGELARWRGNARFLVATQSMGGHGLTLNEAAYTIFYADSFKYSERMQAEDRNHRIGQARRVVYITLGCRGTIDDRIGKSLVAKSDTVSAFMAMVAEFRAAGKAGKVKELIKSL